MTEADTTPLRGLREDEPGKGLIKRHDDAPGEILQGQTILPHVPINGTIEGLPHPRRTIRKIIEHEEEHPTQHLSRLLHPKNHP